ncbi:hypothetical protein GQX74_006284 [Glossina fuscipes]|nr:hypothetical protein GQX74_006284 [Glossina fuscipes]
MESRESDVSKLPTVFDKYDGIDERLLISKLEKQKLVPTTTTTSTATTTKLFCMNLRNISSNALPDKF